MDYSQPERASRLAAEYVLGTLRGPARQRFERLLPAHAALRQALQHWQQTLIPLSVSVPAVPPTPEVWERIQERVCLPLEAGEELEPPPLRWWEQAAPWRIASVVAVVLCLGLAAMLMVPQPPRPPQLVPLSLSNGPASFVVAVAPDGRSLVVTPIGGLTLEADHVLRLWALPRRGGPRLLGSVPAHRSVTLTQSQPLDNLNGFALSIDPPGARPEVPTQPYAAIGQIQP